MKKKITIFLLSFLIFSCTHHKKPVILKGTQSQKEVIYKTEKADFYFGLDDLIKHCQKEDNGEPNDFSYRQTISYLTSFKGFPVIIPDTLGTKLEKERNVDFNNSDSLVRIRDQEHPHAYVTDIIRWTLLDFAYSGKLKIFDNDSKTFIETIIIDRVETDYFGETNIILTNDSVIFSQLRWIR